mmetsp:Transcript_2675/g.4513  ORF Transcript_2675/g.4513 Transcript_2675/m.4513 type:complete len:767 (+) Transcript_2675:110-2410(+)
MVFSRKKKGKKDDGMEKNLIQEPPSKPSPQPEPAPAPAPEEPLSPRQDLKRLGSFKEEGLEDNTFIRKNGYDWDMAMVFPTEGRPAESDPSKQVYEVVADKLYAHGIETYMYYSAQNDEIICKLRCPVDRLRKFADSIDYKMLMSEKELQAFCEQGNPELGIGPINITHDPEYTPLRPYEFVYGKYEGSLDESIYVRANRQLEHPFSQVHRIKLMVGIIENKLKGCGIKWRMHLFNGNMLAFFPLHNDAERAALRRAWLPTVREQLYRNPAKQPVWDIKQYLGEKVAMYFAFLGHYTNWLLGLSFIGILVTVYDGMVGTLSSVMTPYFAAFVAFWAVLMLEYWKRRQATLAMEWGMTEFEEEQLDRPEFHGTLITSYVDGKPTLYFPKKSRDKRVACSQFTVWVLILVVVISVAFIFIFKNILKRSSVTFFQEYYSTIASLLNSIQIGIFNKIYGWVSVKLNDRENHRTDTEYEDALIAKTFMFQFVNSYATFYYTAFVKTYVEGCDYGYVDEYDSCMYDLALSLGIIFCTRIVSAHLLGVTVPRFMARRRAKKELEGTDASVELSPAEQEYTLDKYDKLMGTLKDFAELSIQFGYVTLFVTAFPIAPALAWFANYIQIGVNARKLLFEAQRAMPSGLQDIGAWQGIFETLAGVAVITNAGLVVFTSNKFDHWGFTTAQEVWIFIIMQYLVFGVMRFFANLVEDVPFDVQVQIKRSAHIESKLILQVPDDAGDVDRSLMVDKDRDGVADPAGPVRGGDDGARSGTD